MSELSSVRWLSDFATPVGGWASRAFFDAFLNETSRPKISAGTLAPEKEGWLGLLDGAEPPGIGPHRPGEGPILLELDGLAAAAIHHLARALLDGVVEQARQEAHGEEVLATFLPGLRRRHRAHGDVLQPVDPPLRAQTVAVLLHGIGHVRREHGGGAAHVTLHPRRLHLEEDIRGLIREAGGIEAAVHLTDIGETTVEIARRRRRHGRGGGGLVGLRLALPRRTARALAIGGRLLRLPISEHAPQEKGAAGDEQDLEEPDAAAHAHAMPEEHAAEQAAQREAGEPAHDAGAPARPLRLRSRRDRRGWLTRRRRGFGGRGVAARSSAAARASATGAGPCLRDNQNWSERHHEKTDQRERSLHGGLLPRGVSARPRTTHGATAQV